MDKSVIEARQQLKDRMKELLKRPPPTLEEVRKQWEASYRQYDKNPYEGVNFIK